MHKEEMLADKELWFYPKEGCCDPACKSKHYIIGNAHTFHGRFLAYCEEIGHQYLCSANEVKTMSVAATYWLKGFLSGNEPAPPVDKMGDRVSEEHGAYLHWEDSIALFHLTGYWNEGERECDLCGKPLLYSQRDDVCQDCSGSPL